MDLQQALTVPIARKSDEPTSHAAAREVTESGRREGQLLAVLALVRKYPGRTSLELASLSKLDRHVIARRLPELETAGYISRGEIRKCTAGNRSAMTWYGVSRAPEQLKLSV